MKKIVLLVLLLVGNMNLLMSQNLPDLSHCNKTDPQGFFYFDENTTPMGAMFTTFRDSLLKHPLEDVTVTRTWTDNILGMDHIRYQQLYDGAPIEGAEFTEHGKDGYLVFSNGKLAHNFPHDCSGTMTEQDALAYLLAGVTGNYAWTDSAWEADLQADLNDSTATYYPSGKLLWSLDYYSGLCFNIAGSRYRLAWKFVIVTLNPLFEVAYYVDAITGQVFKKKMLENTDNSTANILTQGTRTIITQPDLFHQQLHATDGNRNIRTKYYNANEPPWGNLPNIFNPDHNWGNNEQLGTTPHWMVTQAWDFYDAQYGLTGMGGGGQVRIYADWNVQNAGYDPYLTPNYIKFGYIGNDYLAVIDVAGHEFTHGVTRYSAALEYESEPGALNESFSDIMGFEVEAYAEGGVSDWLMGEDASALRSLEDPNLFSQPEFYLTSGFWVSTVGCIPDPQLNDNCGIHTNSGVQNQWFYLLSEGGSHGSITVNGIGHDWAALIAYWSLTNTLQSAAQHLDARESSIAAATLLFGPCSNEVIQTTNAWASVAVGDPSTCNPAGLSPGSEFAGRVTVSPNPATEAIVVRCIGTVADEIQIIDLSGQVLKSVTGTFQSSMEVNISGLPAGLYICRVIRANQTANLKVIKQ